MIANSFFSVKHEIARVAQVDDAGYARMYEQSPTRRSPRRRSSAIRTT